MLSGDLPAVNLAEPGKDRGPDIGLGRCGICPKRESTTTSPMVVVQIWDEGGKCKCRARGRGAVMRRSQIDLPYRMRIPECRVGSIEQTIVRDDPLPVERSETVADRSDRRIVLCPTLRESSGASWPWRLSDGTFADACPRARRAAYGGEIAVPCRSGLLPVMSRSQRRPRDCASGAMTQVRPGITPEPL